MHAKFALLTESMTFCVYVEHRKNITLEYLHVIKMIGEIYDYIINYITNNTLLYCDYFFLYQTYVID